MARNPTPAPESKETPANELVIAQDFDAANQLAVLETAAQENVIALAHQLGYEGALTVGTLEDEIRFFQRRTVEALLETGKRLILLQKVAPHGEFLQRVELLGFAKQSAYRFMSAAQKTSKSTKLGLLSSQVKNSSAFLELITHDDDVIDNLAELDSFDRMSASQLRVAVRDMAAEKEATDKLLANKNAQMDKLSRHIAKSTPDEVLLELQKESTALMNDALGCIRGQIRQAFVAIKNHSEADHSLFMAGLVGQLQGDLNALREEFNLPDISTVAQQVLASEVAQWATPASH